MAWRPRRKCARGPHLEPLKFIVERSSELQLGHDAVSLFDADRETPQLLARLSSIALHHYGYQIVHGELIQHGLGNAGGPRRCLQTSDRGGISPAESKAGPCIASLCL